MRFYAGIERRGAQNRYSKAQSWRNQKMFVLHFFFSFFQSEIDLDTQPNTESSIVSTAAFFQTSIHWKLTDDYELEFRLKSKHKRQQISVDPSRKSTDVAEWSFDNWAVYGIRECTKKNGKTGQYVDTDGVFEQNGMRLKPFLAAHHNEFVGDGELKKSLNRIVLVLHKRKGLQRETTLKINNKSIPLVLHKQTTVIKEEISSSEEGEIRKQMCSHSRLRSMTKKRKRRQLRMERECTDSEDEAIIRSYYQKLQKQNESQCLRINILQRRVNEMRMENEGNVNALKMEINSLQNELALYRNNESGKDEKIFALKNEIKILKNDKERMGAMSKNEQITFHQQMHCYQTRIAQQLQQIMQQNEALRQEKEYYKGLVANKKRRKLNNGNYLGDI